MTRVIFHSEGSRLAGFSVSGHSDYDDEGQDIVCAAISSAVRLVEATVNDVLGLAAAVKVEGGEEAFVSLHLPASLGQTAESTCQALLAGMLLYFLQLSEEYPQNVEVLEEGLEDG